MRPRLRTMLPILTSIAYTGEPFASGGAGAVGSCLVSLAALGHTMAGLLIGLLIGLAIFLVCRRSVGRDDHASRGGGGAATTNGDPGRRPSVVVSLRDIVNEMVELNEDHTAYLNRKTGELVALADEVRELLEQDRSPDVLPQDKRWMISKARAIVDTDDFIELPPRFEIHEYSLIERFCDGVHDPDQRQQLKTVLDGPKAFRSFSEAVGRLGIEQEWFRFRDQAFEDLAIGWLDEHQIAYNESSASG